MGLNKVAQIDESTWSIEELNGMVYAFLLVGRDRAVLLDTGFAVCDYRKYAEQLTKLPVDVINTHGHLDHIGQDAAFDRVYIHEADIPVYAEHSNGAIRLEYLRSLLMEAKLPKSLAYSKLTALLLHKFCYIPVKEDLIPISDGTEFDLGGRTLRIIHTPGHTPGSVCILDMEKRRLFSGDTICDEGVLLHFDHSMSVTVFRESARKLKEMSSAWDEIWPCHHLKPIGNEFIDEYVACADEIIADPSIKGSGDGVKIHRCGRIALSYLTTNI